MALLVGFSETVLEGLGLPKTFKNQWFDVRLTFAFSMHKPNKSSTRCKRILRRNTQAPIRLQLLPRKCGEISCPGYMSANESTSRSGLQQQLMFVLPLRCLRFAFVSPLLCLPFSLSFSLSFSVLVLFPFPFSFSVSFQMGGSPKLYLPYTSRQRWIKPWLALAGSG